MKKKRIYKKLLTWWKELEKKRLPEYAWDADPLTFWRERVLLSVYFLAIVLCPFALVPSLAICIHLDLWNAAVLDIMAYFIAVFMFYARNLPISIRAGATCMIFYCLGAGLLLFMGPEGVGYLWLFGASVMAGSLIGLRAGLIMMFLNCCAFICIGTYIIVGTPVWFVPGNDVLAKWVVMAVDFMVLNGIISVTTALMLEGLKMSLLQEQKFSTSMGESEERYRLLSDNVSDVIWTMDLKRKFTFVSPSIQTFIGYKPFEVMSRDLNDVLLPKEFERADEFLKNKWNKLINDPILPAVIDLAFVSKSGMVVWGESRVSIIVDENGEPKSILGVTRDITDRKQTEKALRESEQKYRLLAENANDIIWTADLDLKPTYISPSAERLRGDTTEKIMALSPKDVVVPESIDRLKQILTDEVEKYKKGEKLNSSVIFDAECYCKDGSTIWLENSVSSIKDANGKATEMFGICRDITDRRNAETKLRKSEERLRAIFEAAENVSLIITSAVLPEISILEFSPGAEKIFGYKRAEMIGQKIYSLHDQDGVSLIHDAYRQMKEGNAGFSGETTMIREDGAKFPALFSTYPLFDDDREMNAVLCVSIDISEQTQLKNQLIQSEKMAALGGLVAGIVHEISTPLGVALTSASFLRDRTEMFKRKYSAGELSLKDREKFVGTLIEASGMTLSNISRAVELLNSFKQVAVDHTGEIVRNFNMKTYLEDIIFSLNPQFKRDGHRISVNCPDDLTLDSYPGAFYQIVSNLVMNSVIHGFGDRPNGRIDLDVSVKTDKIYFVYQDNGNGIDSDNLGKIFDPFFTTKRNHGGTGLGLHIVYNIVTQRLAGQILCESKLNQGANFKIEIPLSSIQPSLN